MKKNIYVIVSVWLFISLYSCSKKDSGIAPVPPPASSDSTSTNTSEVNYKDSSISDLMSSSSGSTYSGLTPMGKHFENLHVTTNDDITWLNTANNEPPVPASVSGLHWATARVELFFYGEPDPIEVNQHSIGDCDGLAAMACMAYEAPDFVKSLIKDNGDGTYTVNMYDPQGKKIEVSVTSKFLTGDDGKLKSCTSHDGTAATWATVLEKAIIKYNVIYKFIGDIGGIGSEYTTPLFTGQGNSFAFAPGSLNAQQLKKAVKVALAHGQFVTGGFRKANILVGDVYTVTGHAYTLVNSLDSTALFSMRNPWGFSPSPNGNVQNNGMLDVPDDNDIVPMVDVRIIDPGAAGSAGISKPYQQPTL